MEETLKNFGLIKKNFQKDKVYVTGGLLLFSSGLIILLINYVIFVERKEFIIQLIFLMSITTGAGLFDDICGSKDNQGFSGHIRVLFKGEVTTGLFKAATISTAIFLILRGNLIVRIIDFGLIVFLTNFMNLLDLRPGRSIKFFFLFSFFLLFFSPSFVGYFIPIYILLMIYLPYEMNCIFMLGDSGANLLGIILGFPLIYILSFTQKTFLFVLFLLLNILAEIYSFSEIISQNRPLRFVDRLGRN
jgi:hypothetical protein